MESLLGKTEVIRNWCWRYYEIILENFFEVISVKSQKTTKECNKNYEKNIGNISHKLLKNILMKILWNFHDDFWMNLWRIMETSNNFLEKFRGTSKKFWKCLGRS